MSIRDRIVSRATAWYWLARSLIVGRLYYENADSERWPRRFVWSSLRPRPEDRVRMWLMSAVPSWVDRRDCGCVRWRGQTEVWCGDHLLEELA